MLDQRSDSWRKVSWLAGIGAIVGGPVGYGVGSALADAGYAGAIVGSLVGSTVGTLIGRPDSAALGYVAAVTGAGSYLLGGLIGVLAWAMTYYHGMDIVLDLLGMPPGSAESVLSVGTIVSAVVGGTWLALLLPWMLARGPFPGVGPGPRP